MTTVFPISKMAKGDENKGGCGAGGGGLAGACPRGGPVLSAPLPAAECLLHKHKLEAQCVAPPCAPDRESETGNGFFVRFPCICMGFCAFC